MRPRTTLVVPALTLILCTTMALAQAPSAPPKPGPEAKKLGLFVGKWSEEGDVKPGPMGGGGKMTGSETCEWIADGYGVLCRESSNVPGMGKSRDVSILAYDAEAKNYFFTQVSAGGTVWVGRGTVDGDTWVWTVDTTMNGKPVQMRFTNKWTSPDSFDFKNEIGTNADSMKVMMDGKETRVKASAAKPAPK